MSDDAFLMAIIAGGVAKAAGTGEGGCPHPALSALACCWRYGWRGGRVAGRNNSRETSRETRPGRGRSALGPRREWSRKDLLRLDNCVAAGMSAQLTALVLKRSYASIRTMASKRRTAQAKAAA